MLQLSEIYVYPIKSLGGVRLSESLLTERGLAYDRRWMLIDDQGFMTQRKFPRMALLQVALREGHLEVRSPDDPLPLVIPLAVESYFPRRVPIWDDLTTAWQVSRVADAWFSEALDHPCSLVYMPDDSERTVTGKVSGQIRAVSFADSYPALLVGQASLDDLNTRLAEPVPMDRFRPNLVVTGGAPYEEDRWHAFRLGEAACTAEKACARCNVTTINQATAERGKEPLATLSKYRRRGNKVLFGQNVLLEVGKMVRVGDVVRVETYKPEFS